MVFFNSLAFSMIKQVLGTYFGYVNNINLKRKFYGNVALISMCIYLILNCVSNCLLSKKVIIHEDSSNEFYSNILDRQE